MNAMQPPQSAPEIKAGLETTEKGGVRQSIRNCLTVFQRDPLLSGAIAYNILTDRKDIIFYAWHKKGRVHYMHGVWHLFVLLGSVLHYLCILLYVLPRAYA